MIGRCAQSTTSTSCIRMISWTRRVSVEAAARVAAADMHLRASVTGAHAACRQRRLRVRVVAGRVGQFLPHFRSNALLKRESRCGICNGVTVSEGIAGKFAGKFAAAGVEHLDSLTNSSNLQGAI